MDHVVQAWRLSPKIQLLASHLVEVPTAIGWLRPMILLPLSSFAGLNGQQLELIVAHELAHIRRHDYLVNLLQNAVEALLFYHPAVWWVSSQIRTERENCCDDLALSVSANPVAYARALACLEEQRARFSQMKLAVSGGSLLQRVQRLLGYPAHENLSAGWIALGVVAALFVSAVISHGAPQPRQVDSTPAVPIQLPSPSAAEPVTSDIARAGAAKESGARPTSDTTADAANSETPLTSAASLQTPPAAVSPPAAASAAAGSDRLSTRVYKVEPNLFARGVRGLLKAAPPGEKSHPQPTATGAFVDTLGAYLGQAGLDFGPVAGPLPPPNKDKAGSAPTGGKALLFNERTGQLLVRATQEELDRVEKAIETALAYRQVRLHARWIEMKDSGPPPFDWLFGQGLAEDDKQEPHTPEGDQPGANTPQAHNFRIYDQRTRGDVVRLSEAQAEALLRVSRDRPGVDILTCAAVTTLSGLEASVSLVELKNVVAGVEFSQPDKLAEPNRPKPGEGPRAVPSTPTSRETTADRDSPSPTAPATKARVRSNRDRTDSVEPAGRVTYTPIPVSFGPSLKVQPFWKGDAWNLTLVGQLTEFLGYAEAGVVTSAVGTAAPLTAKVPQPQIRLREVTATVSAHAGDSLLLRMPSVEETVRMKKGWFSKPTESRITRRLYLLISVTEPDASVDL
ncbi:MAG: M56 family metallopeptidase [Verrucomicrobiota bacterium]